MPNVPVPAAAIGLPAVTAADVAGLRFLLPSGRFNLSAIMAAAHRVCASWAGDPRMARIYLGRRSRFRAALREAWSLAKRDHAIMQQRQWARAETARLAALSGPGLELARVEADLLGCIMSDMPARALVAEVAALNAQAAFLRSTMEAARC